MKNNLSKLVLSLVVACIIMPLFSGNTISAFAENSENNTEVVNEKATSSFLKDIKNVGEGKKDNGIFNDLEHPDAPAGYEAPGSDKLLSPIYYGIDLFRYFISGIAVLVFVIQGITLVFSDDEETWKKSKEMMKWAAIGLIIIQLATMFVMKMFFGNHGEVLESNTTAKLYAGESSDIIRNLLGMMEIVMAAVAVLMIVYSGFKISISGGEEEEIGKEKNRIMYGIAGLFIIILSEVVVRQVIFPDYGEKLPSAKNATFIIVGIVNYISMFTGFIAFLSLLYAGYMYVVSGGDDDSIGKVKKIFLGAVIGMLLSLGSYAIVNTMVTFNKAKSDSEQIESLTS